MQQPSAYYKEILSGFIQNTISGEEVRELYAFIERDPHEYERLMREAALVKLVGEEAGLSTMELLPEADLRIRDQLLAYASSHTLAEAVSMEATPGIQSFKSTRKWWWAAAAALVTGIATAVIVSSQHKPDMASANSHLAADVRAPLVNRATIRLADGRIVAVDSLTRGLLAEQGKVQVVKLAEGQIAYQPAAGGTGQEGRYNTLYNPRGSKVIDMTLTDGSRVWLNAGSSVTYPVVFTGGERKVGVTGEAYFEVAPDAKHPFYVTREYMEVQVLGTHFNVNAYPDEQNMRVTLLEGSVQVITQRDGPVKNTPAVKLKPGQQAIVGLSGGQPGDAGSISVNATIDVDQVMAWKNGFFNFNRATLQDMMRQLARWYDVKVEYRGTIAPRQLGGEMQRDLNLSEVLEGLKDIGVHFKIEEGKLIVTE